MFIIKQILSVFFCGYPQKKTPVKFQGLSLGNHIVYFLHSERLRTSLMSNLLADKGVIKIKNFIFIFSKNKEKTLYFTAESAFLLCDRDRTVPRCSQSSNVL